MDRFRNGLYRRFSGSYKLKTMTETVRSLRDQQRAGGGASPVRISGQRTSPSRQPKATASRLGRVRRVIAAGYRREIVRIRREDPTRVYNRWYRGKHELFVLTYFRTKSSFLLRCNKKNLCFCFFAGGLRFLRLR